MLDALETGTTLDASVGVLWCDGNSDTRIKSGKAYRTISWVEILEQVRAPACSPKLAAPAIIPSGYAAHDGRSHAAQRQHGHFIMLPGDVDKGAPTLDQVRDALHAVLGEPLDMIIYSSSSATREVRKWRFLVRLADGIAGADYSDTVNALYDLLSEQEIDCDRALARTGQLVYLPNVPPERRDDTGAPLFYQHYVEHQVPPELADLIGPGEGLDLARTPVLARREANRRRRLEETERLRQEREARQAARASTGDTVIDRFNARHTVSEMLAASGYEESGSGQDWRSPLQTSSSFATRDFGDYWVSLSESDRAAALGAPSTTGGCYGDAFDLFMHFQHGGDRDAALDAAKAEETLAGFAALPDSDGAAEEETPASPSGLNLIVASSLHGKPVPPRRWHVSQLVPAGTVTLLSGDGGVGKSLLALQMAVATAAGARWVGQECAGGGALVLAAEDDLDEVHRRLVDICGAEMLGLDDLHDLHIAPLAGENAVLAEVVTKRNRVVATTMWKDLLAKVEEHRPALVVLDTLADLFAGDENVRTLAQQFVAQLRGLCVGHGCTVVLLSHPSLTGMATGTGTSGSTAWSNSVRSRLYLRKDKGDLRVLETMKSNYAKTGTKLTLQWANGAFRLIGADDQAARELAQRAGAREAFLEMLARYNAAGVRVSPNRSVAYAPTVFARDKDGGSFRQEDYATAMLELLEAGEVTIEETGPPAKRRRRLVVVRG